MAIEKLVSAQVACELIPMPSMQALYNFLNKHKEEFPGRYRRAGGPYVARCGYEQRLLTETEILKIREMTIHGKDESRYVKAGRPKGSGLGPNKITKARIGRRDVIGTIMQRALSL